MEIAVPTKDVRRARALLQNTKGGFTQTSKNTFRLQEDELDHRPMRTL